MFSRANLRILALLGLSTVVHAGALLAYGYLNPSQPQAEAAAATIQLTLQSAASKSTALSTLVRPPVDRVAVQPKPKVVVTTSQQAVFKVPGPQETALSTESTLTQVPAVDNVVEDLAITLESEIIDPSSDTSSAMLLESELDTAISLPLVEPTMVVEEDILERAVELTKFEATLSSSNPIIGDTGTGTSAESISSETVESDRLASIKTQLGSQLLDALESYFSYPLQARRKGWQGDVLLSVDIAGNGEVYAVQLLGSSGYGVLDRAALKSMDQVRVVDLAQLDLSLATQPLRIEIPVAYRLLN